MSLSLLRRLLLRARNDFRLPVSSQHQRKRSFSKTYRHTGLRQFETLEERTVLTAGALDPSFGVDGVALTQFADNAATEEAGNVVVQPDGKLITIVSQQSPSTAVSRVVRYLPDGSLDTGFGIGGYTDLSGLGANLVLQPDGKILVGGISGVARLTSTGALDPTFDGDGIATLDSSVFFPVGGVAIDRNGKIVVAGERGIQGFEVFRLNENGSLDLSFNTSGIQYISFDTKAQGPPVKIAFEYDQDDPNNDKIVVAGTAQHNIYDEFGIVGTTGSDFAVARLNANGQLDTTFGSNGQSLIDFPGTVFPPNVIDDYDHLQGLVVQPDGTIFLGGWHQSLDNSRSELEMVRLRSDGQLDTRFGSGGKVFTELGLMDVQDFAIQPDGKILAATLSKDFQTSQDNQTVSLRFNANGSLDTSFGTGGRATLPSSLGVAVPSGIAIQDDGRIIVAGVEHQPDFSSIPFVARFDAITDSDGDGIEDEVDLQALTASSDFSDVGTATGGVTTGTITSRGDQLLNVVDAPFPEGVVVTARRSGGAQPATISVDNATFAVSAGDALTLKHGSVITGILAGAVSATFLTATGQTVAAADLSAGAELTFKPETGTFIVPTTSAPSAVAVSFQDSAGQTVALADLDGGTAVTFDPATVTFTATGASTAPVTIVLVGSGGGEATATLSADSAITFDPDTFTFSAPDTNSAPIDVTVNGGAVTVTPGSAVQAVHIDVKPGDAVNSINLSSNGVIAVAILSTVDFDASVQVDASTVLLAGAQWSQYSLVDVNGDGRRDIVFNFRTQDAVLRAALLAAYEQSLLADYSADNILNSTHQTTEIQLTGETVDQVHLEGFDDIDLFLAGKPLQTLLTQLFGI